MATRLFGSTLIFSLALGMSLSALGTARAQSPSAAATEEALPAGESSAESAKDATASAQDLDSLLDMADKNPEALGKVNVATASDPIVEGVSKKEEQLSESPGIVDVITAEDIEQFGAKNLFEVLERATSVYMTGSFLFPRNVASIRGNLQNHEDNHVLVLINGRPYRDVTLGGVNVAVYTAFPIQTIHHIEVIRGPGSVLYGTNAFNGVINIVTKNPDQPMFQVSTLNGSYGWQSYSLLGGNGNEQQGALAGSTYSRSKGWPFTATEDVVAPPPLDTQTTLWGEDNVGLFSMYRRGNFTANVFAARATEEQLGSDGSFPSQRLEDPRLFCDVGYLLEFDDCHSLQTDFTYNYDGTEFPGIISTPGNPIRFFSPSQSFLLEGTYHGELTDNLDMLVGGLVDFHTGKSQMGPFQPIAPFTEIWYGVYMQMEYQVNEWLKLVGGMQANLPGKIKSGIVPRAGVIASLDEHWTAKFLYQLERSIVVPGILFGNPDLVPETIQTFDVQLAYQTEDFRLAATYFHSDYFDIITRVGFPQTYVNQGQMTFDGVELENDWELSSCWRTVSSLTYQDNVRDGVHNTTGVPNWMAKLGIAYHDDSSGWTTGLFDTFFGDSTVPATAVPLNVDPGAYHLVSLNTTLDLNRRLKLNTCRSMQLQFLIQNLLDADINHVEFERELINSFPAGPGRTFYGGFTMAY